jgi:hypothetical protein
MGWLRENAFRCLTLLLLLLVPGWQSGNAPASRSAWHRVGQSAGGPSALKGSNPFPGASAYEALGVFLGMLIRTSRVSSRRQLRAWSLVC